MKVLAVSATEGPIVLMEVMRLLKTVETLAALSLNHSNALASTSAQGLLTAVTDSFTAQTERMNRTAVGFLAWRC